MLRVVKVRLYPNKEQVQFLEQSFGNCRWLWNYCLNLINQTYKDTGKCLSGYDVKRLIHQLKKEFEWLSLAYSACLQQVCLNLGVAFNNFFEKRAGSPSFKSKQGRQSIQYPQNVKVFKDYLTLPKIGDVKAVIHKPVDGKIKTVTISKNCCNQYFASILFEDGQEKPESSTEGKAIGIDVGLTHFCITSEGSQDLTAFDGYEDTYQTRQALGLKKSKAKLSNGFNAHCVDSWVLAYLLAGGDSVPDNTVVMECKPIRIYRRQLHVFNPGKNGYRRPYGGSMSQGLKRGGIVKHPKYGKCYVGGEDLKKGRVSLHHLGTGKRLTQCAKPNECKFLAYNSWRTVVGG